jgi:murein tripeptide amidase MpaA
MNPDGCALGNHRTNAKGLDLNRQWLEPDAGAPEVAGVRAAMLTHGCDLFLDAHGDEIIPHVFAHGTDGVAKRSPRVASLERGFAAALIQSAFPDFQTTRGYPRDRAGEANLRIASNWVTSQFDCLSLTLEMPFADHLDAPDPEAGWSAERSARLGAKTVDALAAVVDRLR